MTTCLGLKPTAILLISSKAADRKKGQASLDAYAGNKRQWARLRKAVEDGDKTIIATFAKHGLAASLHHLTEKGIIGADAKPKASPAKKARAKAPKAAAKPASNDPELDRIVASATAAGMSADQIAQLSIAYLRLK